jgi:hypothetical protein
MSDESIIGPSSLEEPAPPPAGPDADREFLIHWLADRDTPCLLCGYNLRGLTRPVCPECGNELRLSVSLADPYIKAWIALLVALMLPAGLGLLWLVMIILKGPPRGWDASVVVPMICQIAAIPLAGWALIVRRKIQSWDRHKQNLLAVIALVVSAITFLWIFANLLH